MEQTAHLAHGRDGTRLFWTESGRGAPAIVLSDGIGCAGFVWRNLEPALARHNRVIHWNYRGHGRSATPKDRHRVLLDDCVEDLLAVLDAAGERRVVLAGHSMGVQVSLELHRRAPERVAALVLICGAAGHPLDTFHGSGALKLAFPFARNAVERHPVLARLIFKAVVPTEFALELALAHEVNAARVDRGDLARYFDDLAAVDPLLFVRMLASAGETDSSDHLDEVDVPTLILAGGKDTFTPVRLSEAMHRAIPGSELAVVPNGTHVTPLEYPAAIARHVRAFFQRHGIAPAEAPGASVAAPPAAPRPRPARHRAPAPHHPRRAGRKASE
jgi:pimeloyl-ACP methyl ester carboxylesterase